MQIELGVNSRILVSIKPGHLKYYILLLFAVVLAKGPKIQTKSRGWKVSSSLRGRPTYEEELAVYKSPYFGSTMAESKVRG